MGKRVMALLRENEDKICFFAFGAGHFLGNNTVIDVLRQAGLEVEHTPAGQAIPRPLPLDCAARATHSAQRATRRPASPVGAPPGAAGGRGSGAHVWPMVPAPGLEQQRCLRVGSSRGHSQGPRTQGGSPQPMLCPAFVEEPSSPVHQATTVWSGPLSLTLQDPESERSPSHHTDTVTALSAPGSTHF
uniref:Metalloprotease TIKI n=1 Tax=Molossus molossus TaxID=27622 RepID=A0A7J8FCV9_MOLMO|nr:TraB domain containing 2B [Molossus molossus]